MDEVSNKCELCSPNCDECPTPTQCFICAIGYRLLDGRCFPECPNKDCTECLQEGCVKCSTPLEGDCLECSDKFYLDEGFCFECNPKCQRCKGPALSDCLTCTKDYNGLCLDNCPKNTYDDKNECKDCPKGCKTCEIENDILKCITCESEKYTNNNGTLNLCEAICENSLCSICDLEFNCLSCIDYEYYHLFND